MEQVEQARQEQARQQQNVRPVGNVNPTQPEQRAQSSFDTMARSLTALQTMFDESLRHLAKIEDYTKQTALNA